MMYGQNVKERHKLLVKQAAGWIQGATTAVGGVMCTIYRPHIERTRMVEIMVIACGSHVNGRVRCKSSYVTTPVAHMSTADP